MTGKIAHKMTREVAHYRGRLLIVNETIPTHYESCKITTQFDPLLSEVKFRETYPQQLDWL
jgi:hypothetical protein